MLSEEEKKAIKILGTFEFRQKTKNYNKIDLEDVGATNIVLNLITKLQKENKNEIRARDLLAQLNETLKKEIKEKDKQIDLMAEVMFKNNTPQLIIEYGIENKEQIIKEFEKLVKEKGE